MGDNRGMWRARVLEVGGHVRAMLLDNHIHIRQVGGMFSLWSRRLREG